MLRYQLLQLHRTKVLSFIGLPKGYKVVVAGLNWCEYDANALDDTHTEGEDCSVTPLTMHLKLAGSECAQFWIHVQLRDLKLQSPELDEYRLRVEEL